MPARPRTQSFATRKTNAAHIAEIRQRVAKRGGTRHVQGGSLKLQVPIDRPAGDLVS